MSWIQKLYETYEASLNLEGISKPIPICHTVQNAHIHIVLDGKGNFIRAKVLEKTQIILPATERSAGRTRGKAPHPLADTIQYLAGDYSPDRGKKPSYFTGYEEQLGRWVDSPYTTKSIQSVYRYIQERSVLADLIKAKIIFMEDEILISQWPGDQAGEIPDLLRILPKTKQEFDQSYALVCWSVEDVGISCPETWKDREVYESWIQYNLSGDDKKSLCYVTGKESVPAQKHPAKLRHSGDKAKLISANDSYGFTFRGRFTDSEGSQAVTVGTVVSQKAHNALRWLIERQGCKNGDQVILAWAVSGKPLPPPVEEQELCSLDLNSFEEEEMVPTGESPDHTIDLGQSFARKLNKHMRGYKQNLTDTESIIIMAMDSASLGRMGIIYYRESFASEYIEQLIRWYGDFAWPQRMVREIPQDRGKAKNQVHWKIASPTLRTIVHSVYGHVLKSADSLKKNCYERLLPCIVEGKNIPLDLMQQCINQAKRPESMEHWEWEKTLGVACSLFKGFYIRHPNFSKRRSYKMALDLECRSRDYLYGRLLAVAEKMEGYALFLAEVKRPTTAEKLMNRFSDRPFSTWTVIEKQMQPYLQQLDVKRPGAAHVWKEELDSIMGQFDRDAFVDDYKLSGEFLLGFHCQRLALNQKNTNKGKEEK